MDSESFISRTGISRETFSRLKCYADTLLKWQPRINLISNETLDQLWERHFLDSIQLARFLPGQGPVLDIGSGGGFPGLALAIVTGLPFHLVESDTRKGAFLREAIRRTDANATVHPMRIEHFRSGLRFTAITARALKPLPELLSLAGPFLHSDSICVFPKGRNYIKEIDAGREAFDFTIQTEPSLTDPGARILLLTDIHRGAASHVRSK